MTMIKDRSVDVITHDKERNEGVLIAVEDRPWQANDERFAEMIAKIDYYVAVIQSGQLSARYPQLKGRPWRIQLDFVNSPGPELNEFLNSISEDMSKAGIQLAVRVLTVTQ